MGTKGVTILILGETDQLRDAPLLGHNTTIFGITRINQYRRTRDKTLENIEEHYRSLAKSIGKESVGLNQDRIPRGKSLGKATDESSTKMV